MTLPGGNCIGSSGICCGQKYPNSTRGWCNLYCVASGRQCCGCNYVDSSWICVTCLNSDVCLNRSNTITNIDYACYQAGTSLTPLFLLSLFALLLISF